MKFSEVLTTLRPARRPHDDTEFIPPSDEITLEQAREKLDESEQLMRSTAGNHWEYYTEAGYAAYWTCLINILSAIEFTGDKDNLPDVDIPDVVGVSFIDTAIQDLDFFGRRVLMQAQVLATN